MVREEYEGKEGTAHDPKRTTSSYSVGMYSC